MERIEVEATHPCWRAYDDDDWNGATFGNWMRTIKQQHPGKSCIIVLSPPEWATQSLVDAIAATLSSVAADVKVLKRATPQ